LKKLIVISVLIATIVLTLTAMPAVISADDEPVITMDIYPGCTTTIKLHAWDAEGEEAGLMVFKFAGSFEDLLDLGVEELLECLVYGSGYFVEGSEGIFEITSNDWLQNIELKLSPAHYFAILVTTFNLGEELADVKEFDVSVCNEIEEEAEEIIIPWVRDVEMTCHQVWINEDNNFEFVFWWEYANNNWVKIYDMAGNEVFSIDMKKGNARFEADLPDGMYTVKTFHNEFGTPIQEFLIGKP